MHFGSDCNYTIVITQNNIIGTDKGLDFDFDSSNVTLIIIHNNITEIMGFI